MNEKDLPIRIRKRDAKYLSLHTRIGHGHYGDKKFEVLQTIPPQVIHVNVTHPDGTKDELDVLMNDIVQYVIENIDKAEDSECDE